MNILSFIGNIAKRRQPSQQDYPKSTGPYKAGRPSRQPPPHEPGEYRWVNIATGIIEYVGETVDLYRRYQEHARQSEDVSPRTHHYEWQRANPESTSATRRGHERSKIAQHKPRLNKRAGGGGRKAKS